MHGGRGGGWGGGCRAVLKRNADCFHVWGGQENGSGCSQVRFSPNEKSCVWP